ncbi:MAG: hypothetical protein ACYCW6_19485, partial [Candidatus Xenobia bacterium]
MRCRVRGSSIPFSLVVVALLFSIAAALAIVSTMNLNLASSEELGEQALDLARAGINQFALDVENGALDSPPQPPLGINFFAFRMAFDPFLSFQQNQVAPYAFKYLESDDNLGGSSDGKCYITFNSRQTQFPYSTSTLDSAASTTGWNGRVVPAFSVDLIATGVVGGVKRALAAKLMRRWSYAVAATHDVYISGTQQNPTQILGDVYTNGGSIHLGYDYNNGAPVPSCNTLVVGDLDNTSRIETSIQVNQQPSPANGGPNTCAGQTRLGCRAVQPAQLTPASNPAPGDFANYTDPTGRGFAVIKDPDQAHHPGRYLLTNTSVPAPTAPAAPMPLTGVWHLDGSLALDPNGTCGGLSLQSAMLSISGDLDLTAVPNQLQGEASVLDVVNGAITIANGFLDGGQNGFVVRAKTLNAQTAGRFTGLIIVEDECSLSPLPIAGIKFLNLNLLNYKNRAPARYANGG